MSLDRDQILVRMNSNDDLPVRLYIGTAVVGCCFGLAVNGCDSPKPFKGSI